MFFKCTILQIGILGLPHVPTREGLAHGGWGGGMPTLWTYPILSVQGSVYQSCARQISVLSRSFINPVASKHVCMNIVT